MGGLIHLVQYKGALQLKPFLLNVLINTVKSQSTKFIVIRQQVLPGEYNVSK